VGIVFEKIPAFKPVQTIGTDSLQPLNCRSHLEETNPDTNQQTQNGKFRFEMDDSLPVAPSENAPSLEHSEGNAAPRRAGERGSRIGGISEEHILALRISKRTQKQAAKELDIGVTALKKLGRSFVIPPRVLYARLGHHLALQFYSIFRICVWDLQGLPPWPRREGVSKPKLRVDTEVPLFHRISPVLVAHAVFTAVH
jgi:hypothetical protein